MAQTTFPDKYRVHGYTAHRQNQGERGTCTAFAVTALLDYAFRRDNLVFSQQYLYARCKLEDMNNNGGTNISTAFQCIRKYGLCKQTQWPYNPAQSVTEAQGTPEMLDTIPVIRMDTANFRMLFTPQNVNEYKAILCGANGNTPMPIVVGCDMFTSSFISRESGNWLAEPAPGDTSPEAHAMLIFGWRDTPDLPSRGYFIAQNSYPKGPENTTDAWIVKIPYDYIANHAFEAGTLEMTDNENETPEATDSKPPMKDKLQMQNEKAIDETAAASVCHKPEKMPAIMDSFFATQRESLSRHESFLPFDSNDVSFFRLFTNRTIAPKDVLASEWNATQDAQNASSELKHNLLKVNVFTLVKSTSHPVFLISAFLASHDGGLVTSSTVHALIDYFENAYRFAAARSVKPRLFFTLASPHGFASECTPTPVPVTFLCSPAEKAIWQIQMPAFLHCGENAAAFFSHLLPGNVLPETEAHLKAWPNSEYITFEALRSRLGLPENAIHDVQLSNALDCIFKKGGYAMTSGKHIVHTDWNDPSARPVTRFSHPPVNQRIPWACCLTLLALMAGLKLLPVLVPTLIALRDCMTTAVAANALDSIIAFFRLLSEGCMVFLPLLAYILYVLVKFIMVRKFNTYSY